MIRPATEASRQAIYQDAMNVIRARYAEHELSLDQVAREVATSPRQLQRAFQEYGQGSFREELCRVRVAVAQRLLRADGRLTVRQVADRVGYRQAPQFAKAFRRVTGTNPAVFRTAALVA